MTPRPPAQGPPAAAPAATPRTDYTGAVYGSLLAESVVAGYEPLGSEPHAELLILLLGTGVAFWAAHVYARLVGDAERLTRQRITWRLVRRTGATEWPIAQAAVPPAVAVVAGPLFGLGLEATLWLTLAVAVIGQVGWATAAVVRAGASRRLVLGAGVVNLVLGALIVFLKLLVE